MCALYLVDQCIPSINYSHSWSFCNHLNVILLETHFKFLVYIMKKDRVLQQFFMVKQSRVQVLACRLAIMRFLMVFLSLSQESARMVPQIKPQLLPSRSHPCLSLIIICSYTHCRIYILTLFRKHYSYTHHCKLSLFFIIHSMHYLDEMKILT